MIIQVPNMKLVRARAKCEVQDINIEVINSIMMATNNGRSIFISKPPVLVLWIHHPLSMSNHCYPLNPGSKRPFMSLDTIKSSTIVSILVLSISQLPFEDNHLGQS